ncbi:hypothetical protein MICAK_3260007 [Microcystis aeruginosa PCC 9701]|uniref:Uncharacterized protein n=1 Tax=Microcystis aeruginosa PCC 9701 TaxID=721123 RepID=I4ISX5_MICAE|nr:hypothetical protein MICAK_3260007 [Microcystis aeruginosa PCC 9701]
MTGNVWLFGLSYATDRIIRDETLIEKDIWRFLSIVFDLERTNGLNLLPDKDLVDLCPPIEPYQVTKNRTVGQWIKISSEDNLEQI